MLILKEEDICLSLISECEAQCDWGCCCQYEWDPTIKSLHCHANQQLEWEIIC